MIRSARGTLVCAATAAVVGVGALLAPTAFAADPTPAPGSPVVTGWAPAGRAAVHPGVFTDGDRVLLGQAAHCGGTGDSTETDGCHSGTVPVGTDVTIHGSDGRDRTGTLAYSSWATMQADGESDPATCGYNDFALVEIAPADTAEVNPSVPFFGGPTGVYDGTLPADSPVLTYGDSTLRMGVEALRPKVGTSAGSVGGGIGHEVYTVTPGIPGDSGSGYLTTQGEAVGVLSTLNLAPLPVSNGVTDLARAMRYAADHGFTGLELEPGTEPFTPNPAALLPSRLPAQL
jgi:hypothetical protein